MLKNSQELLNRKNVVFVESKITNSILA